MRFTENELTAALTGAAKAVVAADRKHRKRGADIDEVWDGMDRYQRFTMLDALGSQILPVLVALPDVEVEPGTRPTFTEQQVKDTVTDLVGEEHGRLRRAVLIKSRIALVQTALAHVPPRLDPDAILPTDGL
ncbi:hypothetical protein [Nocardioides insulae]|uniref:hypothetical protein n=1 Tax=Nocardioides insulae TaxID=394734 RepID=UPI0003F719C1|nr:hypothetical protein [Nocardioides insulae]